MKLRTEGYFDAAHHLVGYEGKCANVHGHRWKVVVEVKGRASHLDENGILWDFTNLKKILEKYDHKDLNKILEINPTAEVIAMGILSQLVWKPNLKFKVRVYESPTSYAEVEG